MCRKKQGSFWVFLFLIICVLLSACGKEAESEPVQPTGSANSGDPANSNKVESSVTLSTQPGTWSEVCYNANYLPIHITQGVSAAAFADGTAYCVTLEDPLSTIYRLYSIDAGGTPTELSGFAMLQQTPNGSTGFAYDVRSLQVVGESIWCVAGRIDQANGEYTLVLLKLDRATGSALAEIDLQEEWGWFDESLCCDSQGNIYVGLNRRVAVYNPEGSEVAQIQAMSGTLVPLSDGTVAFLSEDMDNHQWQLRSINIATWTLSAPLPLHAADSDILSEGRSQFFAGNEQYDFFCATELSLFGYHLGANDKSGYGEHILSWLNCGIRGFLARAVSEDGDGFLCFNDDPIFGVEITSLQPRASSEAEPVTVTLACWELPDNVSQSILQFNRQNNEVQVEIRDYGVVSAGAGLAAGIDRFTADLISGNAPDLFYTCTLDEQMLIDREMLEDLWPWIDNDEELGGRESLVLPFFEAMSQNGKLYTVAQGFFTRTVIGYSDLVGNREGWTVGEFINTYQNAGTFQSIFHPKNDLRDKMLENMISMTAESFIDRENWTANFDSSEFAALLEFVRYFPEKAPAGAGRAVSSLQNRDAFAMTITVGQISEIKTVFHDYLGVSQEQGSLVGYPGVAGNGSVFSSWDRLGMWSGSTHKEEAWAFLRSVLLPENQRALVPIMFGQPDYTYMNVIPTNRKMCDFLLEQLSKNGILGDWVGMEREVIPWSQKDTDRFWDYIERVTVMERTEENIAAIIRDEAERFFAGDQTAEAAAKAIQSRVNLYLGERKK